MLRLSSNTFVAQSTTSMRCCRLLLSQSTAYIAKRCDKPSVKFTSTVKNELDSHLAAMRSVLLCFCSARTSVVDAAHVGDELPTTVTCAYAGYLTVSLI